MIKIARKNHNDSLKHQVVTNLKNKLCIGRSKYDDKAHYVEDEDGFKIQVSEDKTKDKIYSWKTYNTYLERCIDFTEWCKTAHNCHTLDECWNYRNEYIQSLIDAKKSPYTVKLEVSALAKLYGKTYKDFIATPGRHREDIRRSRGVSSMDRHFSEKNHQEIVDFCKCTGLRRSELEHLKGSDLTYIDSMPYVHVRGGHSKGGRERNVPIIGTEEQVNTIIKRMNTAKNNIVWTVPRNMDVHSYRAVYCQKIYNKYARNPDTLPRSERYCCKGDKFGVWYDKNAMKIASEALGHSRIEVIASNYLYNE